MNVWYPVQIRFRDLDPLSHVNNSVFFVYFEEARSYYFDRLKLERWPSQEQDQLIHSSPEEEEKVHTSRIRTTTIGAHYGSLIKENSCTYNLPIIHSDKAEIGVEVVHVGRSSFRMELQIRDSREHERIFATGRTVIVWCNYHTGRPFPVPPVLRAAFERVEGRAFPLPE
ncbi:MAG TPA: thioesterase family protein [Ktedonobacteraceae bacterium]|nr:thioesterase family protein [Ktedonobacteraceae bacterium]